MTANLSETFELRELILLTVRQLSFPCLFVRLKRCGFELTASVSV